MKDIVPELLENIKKDYAKALSDDKSIQSFLDKLRNEKADFNDMYRYVSKVGKIVSKVFKKYLDEDNMPDGILYFNILERTMVPVLEMVNNDINEKASVVQKTLWEKKNIGLNPVATEFNYGRIKSLISDINNTSEEGQNE